MFEEIVCVISVGENEFHRTFWNQIGEQLTLNCHANRKSPCQQYNCHNSWKFVVYSQLWVSYKELPPWLRSLDLFALCLNSLSSESRSGLVRKLPVPGVRRRFAQGTPVSFTTYKCHDNFAWYIKNINYWMNKKNWHKGNSKLYTLQKLCFLWRIFNKMPLDWGFPQNRPIHACSAPKVLIYLGNNLQTIASFVRTLRNMLTWIQLQYSIKY